MDLVDSDVLIDVRRDHPPAVAWFHDAARPSIAVPGFVAMELIQDSAKAAQVRMIREMIAPFAVVWPSEADCQRAMAEFATLRLSCGLGLIDSLIAATAVGRSARLCTFNVKHYRSVPGLVIHQPYSR